jgi:hypothetical protein
MVAFAMTVAMPVANAMALAATTIDGASLRAFLILNLPQCLGEAQSGRIMATGNRGVKTAASETLTRVVPIQRGRRALKS